MQNIINSFQSIPPDVWALIFGSIFTSGVQQKIKNWLELENPKVLVLITGVFSFAAAVIPAALGWLGANPAVIGTHTALFFAAMTLAYRYVIEPGSNKLNQLKIERAAFLQYERI